MRQDRHAFNMVLRNKITTNENDIGDNNNNNKKTPVVQQVANARLKAVFFLNKVWIDRYLLIKL